MYWDKILSKTKQQNISFNMELFLKRSRRHGMEYGGIAVAFVFVFVWLSFEMEQTPLSPRCHGTGRHCLSSEFYSLMSGFGGDAELQIIHSHLRCSSSNLVLCGIETKCITVDWPPSRIQRNVKLSTTAIRSLTQAGAQCNQNLTVCSNVWI